MHLRNIISSFIGFIAFLLTPMAALAALEEHLPKHWQMDFQPPASDIMEKLYDFHNLLLVIITAVTIFVLVLLFYVCVRYRAKRNPVPSTTAHHTLIEIIWTAIPVLILLVILVPSFRTLYMMDTMPEEPDLTVKVVGYQWYWHYIYPEQDGIEFDSYIIEDKDLKPGQHRLLDVDNRLVLPVDTTVRLQLTSADVIHSWAIPALGVKKDAVPGRLNELWFNIKKPGVYYGQCSELCGVRHAFMPIAIEAVSKEEFAAWVASKKPAAPVAATAPATSTTSPAPEAH